jgi:hypothetical protein
MATEAVENLLVQLRDILEDLRHSEVVERAVRFIEVPENAWMLLWTGLGSLVFWYFVLRENDQPIRYSVPSPKRPEKVEILDQPALKVRRALERVAQ